MVEQKWAEIIVPLIGVESSVFSLVGTYTQGYSFLRFKENV